ncbi:MAG TPA: Rieske 2Fe-2S domain-containing protein [Verrucomicrobiae bacterium]|nr:Rieske 2Fe-2S domain-containing protein [Verrucomicrobiae bacterium]
MPEFVTVADLDSLPPGRGRTVHVRGREYSIWNVGGTIFCLDDECPHRGASLGAGTLEGTEVVCPLHGWAFEVSTGTCALRPDRPARTYPARVVDGRIEILV